LRRRRRFLRENRTGEQQREDGGGSKNSHPKKLPLIPFLSLQPKRRQETLVRNLWQFLDHGARHYHYFDHGPCRLLVARYKTLAAARGIIVEMLRPKRAVMADIILSIGL
jgi:hypothetical protein